MPALATEADVVARLGPLSDTQQARADALLTDASALVTSFTGQQFTREDDHVATLRADGTVIRLPQRPVHDVTTVAVIDGATDRELTGWVWDGLDRIDLGAVKPVTISDTPNPLTFRVTYSYGYDTVPGNLVALVCKMVSRVLTSPTQADGLTSENIGQYGFQMQQGQASIGSGVYLTKNDKADLCQWGYKRATGSIQVQAL